MSNKRTFNWTALLLSVIFLSFFACEKMEKHSPTAVDTTSKNLMKATTSLNSVLSATPDIIVNSTSDVVDFPGPMDVSSLPGPDGLVTLREAIIAANNTSGPQIIGFNIPTSDPGFDGMVFTIKPLYEMDHLLDDAITINGETQASFTGNTNPSGPEVVLNGSAVEGISVGLRLKSADNVIHYLVINGFTSEGILIEDPQATDNVITGCFIGLTASGDEACGNSYRGILIRFSASHNRIGGASPEERNIISGNYEGGIGGEGNSNLIVGNFIGTDVSGTKSVGNSSSGIAFEGSNYRIIGNLIFANGGDGIWIGGSNHQIGGYSAEERNIISGNDGCGIQMIGNSNLIVNNFIGTDVSGTKSVGNNGSGIAIVCTDAVNNRIIDNVISANEWDGIQLWAADDNDLQGNLIGTDIDGNPTLGNAEFGVRITPGDENSTGNRIGGKLLNEGNTIAGNCRGGILVGDDNRPVNNNTIEGNTIHQNSNGGILVIFQSDGIKISQNKIYSNDGLGIDLDWNGVTENDPGDGDTGTNNLMNFPVLTWAHAAPGQLVVKGEIDTPNPETVTIEFFANPVPTPGGDPSDHGEGAIYLGYKKPNPQGKFTAALSPVAVGTLITATATDANGNTSEFAANIEAVFP